MPYDGDNLVEETNATGAVVARYSQTQNIDEPLAMLRSATTSYYHSDGLGSVSSLSSKLTASTGSLTNCSATPPANRTQRRGCLLSLSFAKTPHNPESLSRSTVTSGCVCYSFQRYRYFEFWRGTGCRRSFARYKLVTTKRGEIAVLVP